MKIACGVVVWLAMAVVCAAQGEKRPATVAESINSMWADEERDFVSLADAMPEAKWNFKPTGAGFKDVRTFAEQVKHVACANVAFAKEMRGATPPEGCEKGGPNPAKSKAEIMKYLRDSFAMLNDEINATTEKNMMEPIDGPYGGPNSRLGMTYLAVWHLADHYGQLVEYLRMNGIVPPASRPAAK
ncbi:hypothetical protein Acid345_2671 [Candidatus Koribacter versatilis Ellin345]|uniref:DinB-like domain-containing protein n=1 Tax=Koribacter versatilis (strain Ellin345) TaxID=204669 RepID=Q1IN78_KORVE|nr:DinB family protein [Candidatus Koribacter versatilis]ABF41672.1 hypothetical protein Acid345_2671 [Candidatus Koribacter versatilis Ellin345]